MKRFFLILFAVIMALNVLSVCAEEVTSDEMVFSPGMERAEERVRRFMEAANGNLPEVVYDFLIPEIRDIVTRETFATNWAHERSYPYLIPFWIFYREVTLEEGFMTGTAVFARAARLPGQYEKYGIAYVDGDYYFDAFRTIADGSYVSIFERLK